MYSQALDHLYVSMIAPELLVRPRPLAPRMQRASVRYAFAKLLALASLATVAGGCDMSGAMTDADRYAAPADGEVGTRRFPLSEDEQVCSTKGRWMIAICGDHAMRHECDAVFIAGCASQGGHLEVPEIEPPGLGACTPQDLDRPTCAWLTHPEGGLAGCLSFEGRFICRDLSAF